MVRTSLVLACLTVCVGLLLAGCETVPPGGRDTGFEGAFSGKRVALVIGNGAYKNTSALDDAVDHARLVRDTLRDLNFDVATRIDLDKSGFRRALEDFGRSYARTADIVVVYYAGHGLAVDGRNYLVPVDADIRRHADVATELVSAESIVGQAKWGDARRPVILILDASHDNPFARQLGSTARAEPFVPPGGGRISIGRLLDEPRYGGLARWSGHERNLFVAFATDPGKVTRRDNPFASALARELRQPHEIGDVFTRVRRRVSDATGGEQRPWTSSALDSDIYLVGRRMDADRYPLPSSGGRVPIR